MSDSTNSLRVSDFLSSPASFVDHTILKTNATQSEVENICAEAVEHGFATVCVNTRWIPLCVERLRESKSVPIAVIGFPLGAMATEGKVLETQLAIRLGAKEIDMVISVGDLLAGAVSYVQEDISAVVKAAKSIPVKVIIETCLLNDTQKVQACEAAKAAGAAFVKTSTGFSTGGATKEDIALMRGTVGESMGVKASGGIRSFEAAKTMVEAGASRIGMSASVAMMGEFTAATK